MVLDVREQAPEEGMKSLGLLGMKERAESLGGEVTFQRGSPRGTVVKLVLPLPSHSTSNIGTSP